MQRFYPGFLVALLWIVCFLNYADRQAIFSIFPLLRTELGLTSIQLGVVASCFMLMCALAGSQCRTHLVEARPLLRMC
ncbi:hypothetical protein BDD14_0786 [Edaphobacter modestus]|uniref:MFS transporter n=1 Tax=Edaphobacter modestus TaxID=388466 RepID=A0A4Q7YR60_9BACT|nr:hypothetical protein BDD14_0786 [Edaphobacter modestus]